MGVLLALVCTPSGFHYDGLLLAAPGLIWYFCAPSYRSAAAHAACGAAILATYVVQHVDGWILQRGVAWTGAAIATWAVAEAWDLAWAEPPAAAERPVPDAARAA